MQQESNNESIANTTALIPADKKLLKERLQEAGLNPGLMYGIGGEGGSSVSSGGGTGSEVQGVGNPGTQAVMM